jgi:hypothetical protein
MYHKDIAAAKTLLAVKAITDAVLTTRLLSVAGFPADGHAYAAEAACTTTLRAAMAVET